MVSEHLWLFPCLSSAQCDVCRHLVAQSHTSGLYCLLDDGSTWLLVEGDGARGRNENFREGSSLISEGMNVNMGKLEGCVSRGQGSWGAAASVLCFVKDEVRRLTSRLCLCRHVVLSGMPTETFISFLSNPFPFWIRRLALDQDAQPLRSTSFFQPSLPCGVHLSGSGDPGLWIKHLSNQQQLTQDMQDDRQGGVSGGPTWRNVVPHTDCSTQIHQLLCPYAAH